MKRIGHRVGALRALLAALLAGTAGGWAVAQTTQDDVDWALARSDGTVSAFERYLARHPLGKYAGEAFYELTIRSIDPDAGIGAIEPGAGPDSRGANAVLGTPMDVY
ncbi:MAG: hypothetical protein KDE35_05270 [Geminicoccaceae bacterium]|nr:hypothetical protein [Geminicoccaceae bacterium]